jgi:hypothetical protein
MDTLLSSVERTARKDHVCDASEILRNCYGSAESIIYELSLEGYDADCVRGAELYEWKIKRGQKYTDQTGIYEGSFCTFKAVTPLHEICIKFNMYDD